jgi:hypothetical protein
VNGISTSPPSILLQRPKEFTEIMEELKLSVRGAISGDLNACFEVLDALLKLYSLYTQSSSAKISDTLSDAAPVQQELLADTNQDSYSPIERTFRPMLRWLFKKAKSIYLTSTNVEKETLQILEGLIHDCSRLVLSCLSRKLLMSKIRLLRFYALQSYTDTFWRATNHQIHLN